MLDDKDMYSIITFSRREVDNIQDLEYNKLNFLILQKVH